MEKANIEDIIEEIDAELPEDDKREILYGREHDAMPITKAYLFKENEKEKLNIWQKLYKSFSPLGFHEKYDKPLVKLTEEAGKRQYMKIQYKEDPELEKVCKDIADKYRISITDNF